MVVYAVTSSQTPAEQASTSTSERADPAGLQLEIIDSYCGNGSCPTVYRTDRGTFVVQGFAVSPSRAGLDVPDGEMLVEIPAELVAAVARAVL
jgi:hypothetical protein